jgi:hypothetical protein
MLNLNSTTIVLDLPEGAKYIGHTATDVFYTRGGLANAFTFAAPPGEWEIFTPTEEDAVGWVENISYGGFGRSGEEWKNYIGKSNLRTALESLASLVESNNIKNPVYLRRK